MSDLLKGFADGTQLSDVLQATYNDMNAEFQSRIEPLFADGELADFGKQLSEYKPGQNEFLYSLINHIGLVNVNYNAFQNPLKDFYKGYLEFGDTIEDVYVEPVKGMLYEHEVPNGNPGDLWQTFKPDVDVVFYKINRECVYPITINERDLRRAFMSYRELDKFLSGIMQQLYNGDEIDDFALTMKLLASYGTVDSKNNYYRIHVDAVNSESSAKALAIAVRSVVPALRFPSRKFNAKGVMNWAKADDMYLLVTPEINAYLDVEVLAKSFNMDKAQFMGHVVEVPGFGDLTNTVALLVDKAFLQMYDTFKTMESTGLNARHLTTNFFYHHQGVLAVSPFYTAIQFTTDTVSSVSAVAISGDSIVTKDGQVHNYVATVTGGHLGNVEWSIVGSPQYATINQNGNLVVGANFESNYLTIKAVSVEDSTKYATMYVVVREDGDPTAIAVSGNASVTKGNTATYTATVTGDSTNAVTWELPGNEDSAITISSAGVLTVGSGATANSVVVRAISSKLTSLYADKTVAIA